MAMNFKLPILDYLDHNERYFSANEKSFSGGVIAAHNTLSNPSIKNNSIVPDESPTFLLEARN
jgi:hypothetical protein